MIKKLRLSNIFWISLLANYLFAIIILYALATIPDSTFDTNNPEHVLAAFKLTYVRLVIVVFIFFAYPIVLFTSRKYATFLTVGLTAWVIALYIDDNLVLYKIIEYPSRGLVVFIQAVRPFTIACLIWMSFELTSKK